MIKQLSLTLILFVLAVFSTQAQTDAFITTWYTGDDGIIQIPTNSEYTYDYHIVITYQSGGEDLSTFDLDIPLAESNVTEGEGFGGLPTDCYVTVAITGTFPAIYMDNYNLMNERLCSIDQWGTIEWQSMSYAFNNCYSLTYNATDTPDLSNVSDMSYMFCGATIFNGDISSWDVSNVTNMSHMFYDASAFNCNLNNWDVNKVTDMSYMFYDTSAFNGNISEWKVNNVTDMGFMFYAALDFNQDISGWNVSNVINMNDMFYWAASFSGDVSNWDVSNVTDMSEMFYEAKSFNGDLSNWNVGKVTNMSSMFHSASAFNCNLNNWDVGNVTDMSGMFYGTSQFNSDISNWDVSNVTTMSNMFNEATSFNQDLSAWSAKPDVSRTNMFTDAGDTYYTITYNEDGTEYLGFYPAGHSDITLRTLDAKDGVPFYSWNTASDFSGESLIYIYEGETSDKTLYAEWSTSTSADIDEISSISYYPNPVVNQINIEGLEGDYSYGAIYNSAGVIMTQFDLDFNQNIHQVDMSEYAPGIYLLQLQKANGTTESFKLIKK